MVERDQHGEFRLTDPPGAVPEALYSCATRSCAEQSSYPADMLQWWDGRTVEAFDATTDQPCAGELHQLIRSKHGGELRPGWYCDSCIDHWNAIAGPTLKRHNSAAEPGRGPAEDNETPPWRCTMWR